MWWQLGKQRGDRWGFTGSRIHNLAAHRRLRLLGPVSTERSSSGFSSRLGDWAALSEQDCTAHITSMAPGVLLHFALVHVVSLLQPAGGVLHMRSKIPVSIPSWFRPTCTGQSMQFACGCQTIGSPRNSSLVNSKMANAPMEPRRSSSGTPSKAFSMNYSWHG